MLLRLTDNWVELAVRFVVADHGIREIKDKISRDILDGLYRAGIGIASGTYEVVGMPTLKVQMLGPRSELSAGDRRFELHQSAGLEIHGD
jgi:hypothetical protein